MELNANEFTGSMSESMDRLSAAAALLERTVSWLEQRESAMSGDVQKIVAAVEGGSEMTRREQELMKRLEAAEQQIAELKAQTASAPARQSERKTLPAATTQLLAKQGITTLDSIEAGALDAALTGLSPEQRIAVKAQLIRIGALA
jgi:cell division protein ZapA (FtsZ GTPase activity inhibitor)